MIKQLKIVLAYMASNKNKTGQKINENKIKDKNDVLQAARHRSVSYSKLPLPLWLFS
jgi:hypothetical protein